MMETQLRVNQPVFICGNIEDVSYRMTEFACRLVDDGNRIMYLDTINAINSMSANPYTSILKKNMLYNICLIKAETHYEIWTKLAKAEEFIKSKGIEVLIINSLSQCFADADELEIMPVLNHIMKLVNYLSRKYHLAVLIGNSSSDNTKVMMVFRILEEKNIATLSLKKVCDM